ncbi:MAG: hypothetical protein AVDCRST_MAG48-3316, partial [uncultured Friedmanniella sp.]
VGHPRPGPVRTRGQGRPGAGQHHRSTPPRPAAGAARREAARPRARGGV